MQISVAKGVEKTPKNSVTLDPVNARTGRGTLKKKPDFSTVELSRDPKLVLHFVQFYE